MRFIKTLVVIALFSLGGWVGFSRACMATPPTHAQKVNAQKSNAHTVAVIRPETVLELFTSQGCSSCPKANKFAREMAAFPDVLTLSYSVDYWDYLGWKDTFGKPEFSARQRAYGQQFQGRVYTPQFVLNGAAHGSAFPKGEVHSAVLPVHRPSVYLRKTEAGLAVSIKAGEATAPFIVTAVRYKQGEQTIPVAKGENKGRTIRLPNVVVSCRQVQAGEFVAPPKSGESVAILLHAYKGGPILSAAIYAK